MKDRFPYRIITRTNDWDLAQRWCQANIGEFNETWYKLGVDPAAQLVSGDLRVVWYFKRKEDAVMFSLRWE